MPRKRKSDLSRDSAQARATKIARNQAELRRQQQASWRAAVRTAETSLQTRVRLDENAKQQAEHLFIDTESSNEEMGGFHRTSGNRRPGRPKKRGKAATAQRTRRKQEDVIKYENIPVVSDFLELDMQVDDQAVLYENEGINCPEASSNEDTNNSINLTSSDGDNFQMDENWEVPDKKRKRNLKSVSKTTDKNRKTRSASVSMAQHNTRSKTKAYLSSVETSKNAQKKAKSGNEDDNSIKFPFYEGDKVLMDERVAVALAASASKVRDKNRWTNGASVSEAKTDTRKTNASFSSVETSNKAENRTRLRPCEIKPKVDLAPYVYCNDCNESPGLKVAPPRKTYSAAPRDIKPTVDLSLVYGNNSPGLKVAPPRKTYSAAPRDIKPRVDLSLNVYGNNSSGLKVAQPTATYSTAQKQKNLPVEEPSSVGPVKTFSAAPNIGDKIMVPLHAIPGVTSLNSPLKAGSSIALPVAGRVVSNPLIPNVAYIQANNTLIPIKTPAGANLNSNFIITTPVSSAPSLQGSKPVINVSVVTQPATTETLVKNSPKSSVAGSVHAFDQNMLPSVPLDDLPVFVAPQVTIKTEPET